MKKKLISDPDAQVSFQRDDGKYADTIKLETDDDKTLYQLVFSPFNKDYIGDYKCYARNAHGESEDTATIELEADDSFSLKFGK